MSSSGPLLPIHSTDTAVDVVENMEIPGRPVTLLSTDELVAALRQVEVQSRKVYAQMLELTQEAQERGLYL